MIQYIDNALLRYGFLIKVIVCMYRNSKQGQMYKHVNVIKIWISYQSNSMHV